MSQVQSVERRTNIVGLPGSSSYSELVLTDEVEEAQVGGDIWRIQTLKSRWNERVGCDKDPDTCGARDGTTKLCHAINYEKTGDARRTIKYVHLGNVWCGQRSGASECIDQARSLLQQGVKLERV